MTILGRFVERIDAMRGRSAVALANGMARSAGKYWLRVGGGVNLYRGPADGTIDYSRPIGVAGPFASMYGIIRSLPGVAWAASTEYDLVARAVGCGGVEETSSTRLRIRIDDGGTSLGALPNAPIGLCVRPIAGGVFRLRWRYSSAGASGSAASFHVYNNAWSGAVDYDTIVATVTAAGDVWYTWDSSAFAHATSVKWSVRAVNAAGGEETNTVVVEDAADSEAPDAVQGISLVEGTER